jgi:transcriptional regulator with XRE-family HTH domain
MAQQIIRRHTSDFDLQIDTIQQRPAESIEIRAHLAVPALALVSRAAGRRCAFTQPNSLVLLELHDHTPALPFSGWVLRASKPPPKGYPKSPKSLEEHLKRRRFDLGLRQKDLAALLGVCIHTVRNWETGRSSADLRSIPAAVQFLGGDPRPAGSFPLRLRLARERLGLSQRALAARLGVNPKTLWIWELGKHEPPAAFVPRIEAVIGPWPVDPDAPIGERLRAYRRALGLTQRELAARVGAVQTSVSDWERGDCQPPTRVRRLLEWHDQ